MGLPRTLSAPADTTLKIRSERDEKRRWGTGGGRGLKSQMQHPSPEKMFAIQETRKGEAMEPHEASGQFPLFVKGFSDVDDVASTIAPSTALTDVSPAEFDDADEYQDLEDPCEE